VARWAITGGSGFLGVHLARRLAADGNHVRTLDVEPPDDELLALGVEPLVGDVRDPGKTRELCRGIDVLVHAAAALPIRRSASEIRSVNVEGAATIARAAVEAGVSRAIVVSTTAVYGIPETHPITEETPLAPLGAYGESKAEAEETFRRVGAGHLDTVIMRPKTFLGSGRLGVFEILFDWIREGRRIYVLGNGRNRYQLLAVDDLVEAVVRIAERSSVPEVINLGAKVFGTVEEDMQGLIAHAGSASRLARVPARPAQALLRALELAHLSPLVEWHYRTADKDSFVDTSTAERALGWEPRYSNLEALTSAYDWYTQHRETAGPGLTHRTPWRQQALGVLKRLS
jgi:nucleoside-diphosphate-sugar epimerase